jgi:NMD protein affecting ribosome stability and mRNA decay
MNDSTYEAYVLCKNCLFHKKIQIPKGSLINQVLCQNCGNMTIEIDMNGELFDKPQKKQYYE